MSITMKQLLDAGAHFGHQTHRWNPKMKPYIYGARNGIYIINLEKTVAQWGKARKAIVNTVTQGKKVLFVGTKPQASEIVQEEAERSKQHYVNRRWLGGMLTNFETIKKEFNAWKKLTRFFPRMMQKITTKKISSRWAKKSKSWKRA